MKKTLNSSKISRFFNYFFLVVSAAFFLLPIFLLLNTSLKPYSDVSLATMWKLPTSIGFDSFRQAWFGSIEGGYRGLRENFINSLWLAGPAAILSAFIGSINGYIFSKWRFRGSNVLFALLLFGMFIPYQSILIPLVQSLQWLSRFTSPIIALINSIKLPGILSSIPAWLTQFVPAYGTIGGLILVHVIYGIPIATLVFKNYYTEIPTDLVEAGMMDGAGILGIYRHILFPISVPGFVVVLIWQFTSIWNDFLFGVIITPNPRIQPVTVALNNLAGSYIVEWNVQMAGSLVAAIPTVLIFIFLSRYFLRGLIAGSLKG
ncbi:MAG TPA: carbohydrate ABC transporter permease [Brevefilum sp.]|nr:carbohydrate ABC transporter permease [Brevefilum sp.]